MPHLLPNLRTGRALVCERVRRITKLVHVKASRNLFGKPRRDILVILGMASRHIRPCDAHFGAERPHVRYLFLRHLVGNYQQDAIALRARDQRESQTGVARRSLNHCAAGLEFPLGLSCFDHRQRDSVLNGATRILIFKFEKKLTRPGVELRYFHQRRIADERKNLGRFAVRNGGRCGTLTHKVTRSTARLCATIPTGCLSETVGAQESEPRRSSMRSGDRRLCKSKSSESNSAANWQTA